VVIDNVVLGSTEVFDRADFAGPDRSLAGPYRIGATEDADGAVSTHVALGPGGRFEDEVQALVVAALTHKAAQGKTRWRIEHLLNEADSPDRTLAVLTRLVDICVSHPNSKVTELVDKLVQEGWVGLEGVPRHPALRAGKDEPADSLWRNLPDALPWADIPDLAHKLDDGSLIDDPAVKAMVLLVDRSLDLPSTK
jgi:hypothetical protein